MDFPKRQKLAIYLQHSVFARVLMVKIYSIWIILKAKTGLVFFLPLITMDHSGSLSPKIKKKKTQKTQALSHISFCQLVTHACLSQHFSLDSEVLWHFGSFHRSRYSMDMAWATLVNSDLINWSNDHWRWKEPGLVVKLEHFWALLLKIHQDSSLPPNTESPQWYLESQDGISGSCRKLAEFQVCLSTSPHLDEELIHYSSASPGTEVGTMRSEARWEWERVNFSAHVRFSAVPLGSAIEGPGCMLVEWMHWKNEGSSRDRKDQKGPRILQAAAWDVQGFLVLGKRGILLVQRHRARETQLLSDKSQQVPSALVSQFGKKPPVGESRVGQSISNQA